MSTLRITIGLIDVALAKTVADKSRTMYSKTEIQDLLLDFRNTVQVTAAVADIEAHLAEKGRRRFKG